MWNIIKERFLKGIEHNIPKISKLYDWRKPSYKRPLSKSVWEKIITKQYILTHNVDFLRKYKKIRNDIYTVERVLFREKGWKTPA